MLYNNSRMFVSSFRRRCWWCRKPSRTVTSSGISLQGGWRSGRAWWRRCGGRWVIQINTQYQVDYNWIRKRCPQLALKFRPKNLFSCRWRRRLVLSVSQSRCCWSRSRDHSGSASSSWPRSQVRGHECTHMLWFSRGKLCQSSLFKTAINKTHKAWSSICWIQETDLPVFFLCVTQVGV